MTLVFYKNHNLLSYSNTLAKYGVWRLVYFAASCLCFVTVNEKDFF